MAVSGDDFHIKGVPAHAMVVKPCKTASQVSLACYLPSNAQTQREIFEGKILKTDVSSLNSIGEIAKTLLPVFAKIRIEGVVNSD